MTIRTLPFILVPLIFAIGIINAAAYYWHLYYLITWLDIPMHFFSGIWIALFVLWMRYGTSYGEHAFPFSFGPWAVSLMPSLMVIIGWEIFEFYVNEFITADMYDVADTISDIFFGLLGASLGTAVFIQTMYNKHI